jgi:hypothetical protein
LSQAKEQRITPRHAVGTFFTKSAAVNAEIKAIIEKHHPSYRGSSAEDDPGECLYYDDHGKYVRLFNRLAVVLARNVGLNRLNGYAVGCQPCANNDPF